MAGSLKTQNYNFPYYEGDNTFSSLETYNSLANMADSTIKEVELLAQDAKNTAGQDHDRVDELLLATTNLQNSVTGLQASITDLNKALTFTTYTVSYGHGISNPSSYVSSNGINMVSFRTNFILSGPSTEKFVYQGGATYTLVGYVNAKLLQSANADLTITQGSGSSPGAISGTIYPVCHITDEGKTSHGSIFFMFQPTRTYIYLTFTVTGSGIFIGPASGTIFYGGSSIPM